MSRVCGLLGNVQFAHSLFALPFAVLTAFIVSEGVPPLVRLAVGIIAAIALRMFGLTMNRLIDLEIDARNPRTKARPLPAKRVGVKETVAFALITLAVAVGLFFFFEPQIWFAIPPLLVIITIYPYLKRFTWLCHFGVGLIYLLTPLAVSLALIGEVAVGTAILGVAALFWVTGFDVLYAIADYEFDRQSGIYSIPARFGIARAIWLTRLMHLITASLLFVGGWLLGLGLIYYIGAGVVTLLLLYENALVSPHNLTRLNRAFFTMNGVIAVVLCVFVVTDVVI